MSKLAMPTIEPALSIWTEPLEDVHSERQGPFVKRYSDWRESVDDVLTRFTNDLFPFWKVSIKESFKDPVKKEFLEAWCLGHHLTRLDMYFQLARRLNREYARSDASSKFMLTKKYDLVEEGVQHIIIDDMVSKFSALLSSVRKLGPHEVQAHWAMEALNALRPRSAE